MKREPLSIKKLYFYAACYINREILKSEKIYGIGTYSRRVSTEKKALKKFLEFLEEIK
jgi:hypothetical protein